MNEAFGDTVSWDALPANAIASLNLIPGSNPLFGLNALGGALSIRTKDGFSGAGRRVSVPRRLLRALRRRGGVRRSARRVRLLPGRVAELRGRMARSLAVDGAPAVRRCRLARHRLAGQRQLHRRLERPRRQRPVARAAAGRGLRGGLHLSRIGPTTMLRWPPRSSSRTRSYGQLDGVAYYRYTGAAHVQWRCGRTDEDERASSTRSTTGATRGRDVVRRHRADLAPHAAGRPRQPPRHRRRPRQRRHALRFQRRVGATSPPTAARSAAACSTRMRPSICTAGPRRQACSPPTSGRQRPARAHRLGAVQLDRRRPARSDRRRPRPATTRFAPSEPGGGRHVPGDAADQSLRELHPVLARADAGRADLRGSRGSVPPAERVRVRSAARSDRRPHLGDRRARRRERRELESSPRIARLPPTTSSS